MFYRVKELIKERNIDISHFNINDVYKRGKKKTENILVYGSTYNRYHLKKRLIKE